MSEQPQPEHGQEEPEVQGVPRSLLSTLCGTGAMLMLSGAVCALVSAWDSMDAMLHCVLLSALPLVIVALHLFWARRRKQVVFGMAFIVFFAANILLIPSGWWLAVHVMPAAGSIAALLYAVAMIWYGASYSSHIVITAGSMLAFTAAMSIPLFGMGALAGAVLLPVLGIIAFSVAYHLHRVRSQRLALLQIARKRQEQNQ